MTTRDASRAADAPLAPPPGGIGEVRSRTFTFGSEAEPFVFRSGETLPSVTLAYETYGTLNEDRSNAILVFHALSGNQHAAGLNPSVEDAGDRWTPELHTGWWDAFIGPGKAIDTDRFFVVCANYLGGCYGSSGPCSINPATGNPYARDFPTVMFGDIVSSQIRLLDHLGIHRLHAVVGGSLGGLCAVNFAVRHPDRVGIVIPIAAGARVSVLQRITNYEQICAIEEDKHFNRGYYYDGPPPEQGLTLARMISHKTFVSLDWLEKRAKAEVLVPEQDKEKWYWLSHNVESYLRNQGIKFVRRFDANTYLRIIDAWQRFNLYEEAGLDGWTHPLPPLSRVFDRCREHGQKYLVFSIDSDVCFHPEQQDDLCDGLREAGVSFHHITVHSQKGHDSFLLEPELYAPHLDYALTRN